MLPLPSGRTVEKCGRVAQINGSSFLFGLFSLGSRFSSDLHAHGVPALCLGLQGSITIASSGAQLIIEPDTCWFLPPDFKHREEGGGSCLLATPVNSNWAPFPDLRAGQVVVPAVSRSLASRASGEIQQNDELSPFVLESIFFEAIDRTDPRAGGPCREYAVRIAERIIEEYAAPPSVARLAHEYGFSRQHLARSFHSEFGCSIPEYVRRVRIGRAARLLKTSPRPLSEIALQTGFSDQSHLTRTLKKETGLTPGAFRRKYYRV